MSSAYINTADKSGLVDNVIRPCNIVVCQDKLAILISFLVRLRTF